MERLIADVLAALRGAGLAAMRADPGVRARTPEAPVLCLAVKQAASSAAGFYDYLGVVEDPEAGAVELYGRRVECTLELEARSPAALGAAAAEEAARQALDALLSGAVHARIGRATIAAARLDAAAGTFCCALTVEAALLRYRARADEGAPLTDFELKGEWK